VIVQGAVEGSVDDALLRRLLRETGHQPGAIYSLNGKPGLLKKLDAYNGAARISPWVVLIDLNSDADCAPPYVAEHMAVPSEYMTFRVAVREAEAWLLADRPRLARFLGVSQIRLPTDPESVADPKQAVVNIARHSSRRAVRDEIVPSPGAGRTTGPAYVAQMIEFITRHWHPQSAAARSESLRRCLDRLAEL
jgi:hypothetical protein